MQHQDTMNAWPDPVRLIEAHGRLGLFKCINDDADAGNGGGGGEDNAENRDDEEKRDDDNDRKETTAGGGHVSN